MTDQFIILEVPCRSSLSYEIKDQRRHLYKIPIREDLPGGAYRQILMYDGFLNGKRRFASATDRNRYMGGCSWGPYSLFMGRNLEDLRNELSRQQIDDELRPHVDDLRTWRPLTERYYGKRIHKFEELPFRICSDMDDFFRRIGFDRRSRCYRDDDGTILKYTRENHI